MSGKDVTRELAEETLKIARKIVIDKNEEKQESIDKKESFLSIGSAARYLRGYGLDARKAGRNLSATFEYREDLDMDNVGRTDESARIIWNELKRRSMFIGCENDGNNSPILVIRKRKEAFDMNEFEDYRKSFVFMLECTAKMADMNLGSVNDIDQQKGQWIIIMDMATMEKVNSPPLSVTAETMKIFQRHFPERAKQIVVVDAPSAFYILWRIISPMIDSVTRKKILFVSRQDGDEKLKEQVGKNVLNCINMDLHQGKKTCVQLMVEKGMLLDGFGQL